MTTLKDYELANQEAEKIFASLGLNTMVSHPLGDVRDDWPNILYNVTFSKGGQNLTAQYRLGVGHVRWGQYRQTSVNFARLTSDEETAIFTIQRNPSAQLKNKALWASTAAKLAIMQKISPKPYEVFACLCNESYEAHSQSFADYCDNYGMNSDSIKDRALYDHCCEQYHALVALVGPETIAKLAELHSQF